jgi:hypothetical protein
MITLAVASIALAACAIGTTIVLTLAARFSDQAATAAADFEAVGDQLTSLGDGIDTFNDSANRILTMVRGAAKGGGYG